MLRWILEGFRQCKVAHNVGYIKRNGYPRTSNTAIETTVCQQHSKRNSWQAYWPINTESWHPSEELEHIMNILDTASKINWALCYINFETYFYLPLLPDTCQTPDSGFAHICIVDRH